VSEFNEPVIEVEFKLAVTEVKPRLAVIAALVGSEPGLATT